MQNELLVNELKIKNNNVILHPQEIQDGTLENIILGMKSEPYRTNVSGEGMRKSFRRQRSDQRTVLTSESDPL